MKQNKKKKNEENNYFINQLNLQKWNEMQKL